ncbi:hypothetical protein Mp_8g17550 [Marchantia polymorpha subsp. ruderalis]|uniref:Uncharacterized protein n=1 Tax=Marchantia polymorpha TaxID=3197 RepID=A0A2R6X8D9_MARPO|nr:hypothetical protein MARPO_0030s0089 [Marchantia polymorpha]BBN20235.1 hypothetical protein Mp_8g17550 [Marchantia polymorpha subsp. ruderalis]|eukprot:PTQ42353.1 hypothetical protein MARPO_0030s0089 [Marchantia polymorpha]
MERVGLQQNGAEVVVLLPLDPQRMCTPSSLGACDISLSLSLARVCCVSDVAARNAVLRPQQSARYGESRPCHITSTQNLIIKTCPNQDCRPLPPKI